MKKTMWRYKPDFDLSVALACPRCQCTDLYTVYADIKSLRVNCNQCNHSFYGEKGLPDPDVRELVDRIRTLTTEANGKSGNK